MNRWKTLTLILLPSLLVAASCADSGEAETDLPEDQITLHTALTDVIVNADKYPNFAHTCWSAAFPIGFWSTTDRVTLIIYNDWLCEGANREQPMTVLSGNPQDIVNAGA
jgi:hypothetical protein